MVENIRLELSEESSNVGRGHVGKAYLLSVYDLALVEL